MIYRKLKRTWSNGYINYMPNFKKIFPELSHVSSEELCDRFNDLDLDFYYEEELSVPFLVRLSFPLALLLMIIMFISLPILFLITGRWHYSLGEHNRILNWFRSLHIN